MTRSSQLQSSYLMAKAKQTQRRASSSSSGVVTRLFQLLVIIVSVSVRNIHILVCRAGWIDPDTPANASTVVPLEVVRRLPSNTDDDDDDKTAPGSWNNRNLHRSQNENQRTYSLVFSDEFNAPHRSFKDGDDPRWTALDKNDYTNNAQHYYSSDNAYTDTNGHLIIRSEAEDTTIVGFNDVKYKKERVTKHFKSAMLQSWNKFCFTGGIIEAQLALPGKHDVGGLWPAFWLLGNLARHTYVGTSEHVWPWSSTACTNVSRTAQLVTACNPVQHYGMHTGMGRGAPEIDIVEVQAGNTPAKKGEFLHMTVGQPFLSTSYQLSPGVLPRPQDGKRPETGYWYDNLTMGVNTTMNYAFYGSYNHFLDDADPKTQDYWSDAISFNRQLDASHFGQFHNYRVEWELPDANGNAMNNYTEPTYGYLRWFIDDQFILEIDGLGLHTSGTGGEISSEPMYMLLNTAISSQWGKSIECRGGEARQCFRVVSSCYSIAYMSSFEGFPKQCPAGCPCKEYKCNGDYQETCGFSKGFCDMIKEEPMEYKINWVRVYQDKNDPKQKVGCSTRERPTRRFIKAHEKKYKRDGDVRNPMLGVCNCCIYFFVQLYLSIRLRS